MRRCAAPATGGRDKWHIPLVYGWEELNTLNLGRL